MLSRIKSPAIVLLGGSPPKGCSRRFYLDLIKTAAKQKHGVIVDVPADSLKTILQDRSTKLLLIKPNQTELEAVLNRKIRSDKAIARAALELNKKSAIVCVSLAKRGAIFAVNGQAWFARAPAVKAKGTVGAGDSMVGAMASRLSVWKFHDPKLVAQLTEQKLFDVFRWGLAAGAATAATEGTSLGEPDLIRQLYSKVSIRALKP